MALNTLGQVWTYGAGGKNQLGYTIPRGEPLRDRWPNLVFLGDQTAKYIASGRNHSFAVCLDDSVWAWGCNRHGQAGSAPDVRAHDRGVTLPQPMKIDKLSGHRVISLSGGDDHSVAITAEGKCVFWGRVDWGLFNKQTFPSSVRDYLYHCEGDLGGSYVSTLPLEVEIRGAICVACGPRHIIFIDDSGRIFGYGPGLRRQSTPRIIRQLERYTHYANYSVEIKDKVTVKKKLVWCGSSEQFSMIASLAKEASEEASATFIPQ